MWKCVTEIATFKVIIFEKFTIPEKTTINVDDVDIKLRTSVDYRSRRLFLIQRY